MEILWTQHPELVEDECAAFQQYKAIAAAGAGPSATPTVGAVPVIELSDDNSRREQSMRSSAPSMDLFV
jgi:hypothetical protein